MIPEMICLHCKNYKQERKCLAFNRIPMEIISGKNDHAKPLPKQKNDIVFEQVN